MKVLFLDEGYFELFQDHNGRNLDKTKFYIVEANLDFLR